MSRTTRNTLIAVVLIAGLLLVLFPVPGAGTQAAGNTYYVSLDGDDSNPGTQSAPWRTIQHAADTMVAGDTAVVLEGDYRERVQVSRSGESGSRIRYRADGSVVMHGFTVQADHIVVDGFEITDTPNDWQDGWGIFIQGSDCVLRNNYVHFATRGGIKLFTRPGEYTQTANCLVKNNRLYRNQGAGVDVHGRHHQIEGNEVWGTIQHHPLFSPSWADADGMHFHGSGHAFAGNYIHDISYDDPENVNPHIDCFQTFSSDNKEAASNIVFERNVCRVLESLSANANGSGFMLRDARDLIIRNNVIQAHGGINTGAGGNQGLMIANNVFSSDLTFSTDTHPSGVSLRNCPGSSVLNNIFYDQPAHHIYVDGDTTSDLVVGTNLVYRSDGGSPWGSPYPGDLWQTDPRFVNPESNDFKLYSDSPAIDAGQSVSVVAYDLEGVPRPQGSRYDIGAYEILRAEDGPTATPTLPPTPNPSPVPTIRIHSFPPPAPSTPMPLEIESSDADMADGSSGEVSAMPANVPIDPGPEFADVAVDEPNQSEQSAERSVEEESPAEGHAGMVEIEPATPAREGLNAETMLSRVSDQVRRAYHDFFTNSELDTRMLQFAQKMIYDMVAFFRSIEF